MMTIVNELPPCRQVASTVSTHVKWVMTTDPNCHTLLSMCSGTQHSPPMCSPAPHSAYPKLTFSLASPLPPLQTEVPLLGVNPQNPIFMPQGHLCHILQGIPCNDCPSEGTPIIFPSPFSLKLCLNLSLIKPLEECTVSHWDTEGS